MLNVIVSTVDSKLEFALHKNSLGRQLFDQVVKTQGIREVWYFGIQYTDKENNLAWLKLDKKVTNHDLSKEKPPVFYFRVKFYPEDVVEELIEDLTREFFYLQVKSSILKGDIYCPPEIAVLLASYVCHVRLGPYESEAESSVPEATRLLPATVIESHDFSDDEWREKIINCYKQHKDFNKEEAIMEYLKICQDLEMYGVTYYPIKNKKGTKLWLGIDAMGLNIYEYEDKLTPKIGFPWDEVKKVSFKSKKFILLPTDKSAKEWHFMVERVRFNRQILQLSIGNHELYIRRRKSDSIEVQQMKTKAQELREAKAADKQRLNQERYAREEMERRVKEVESEADRRREEYEEAMRMAKEYELQLSIVQEELQKEREAKILLASTQEQLRYINQQLEAAVATSAEEKTRLESEHNKLQNLIKQQEAQIETQSKLNVKRSEDLMSLKKKVTVPVLITGDINNDMKNGDCLSINGDAEDDINNNTYSNQNDNEAEKEHDDRALEVLDKVNRKEEDRQTEFDKDKVKSKQIEDLRSDLKNKRNNTKMKNLDIRNEENQKKGLDKFKTLRQIRQGNTKKRVDQFEAM